MAGKWKKSESLAFCHIPGNFPVQPELQERKIHSAQFLPCGCDFLMKQRPIYFLHNILQFCFAWIPSFIDGFGVSVLEFSESLAFFFSSLWIGPLYSCDKIFEKTVKLLLANRVIYWGHIKLPSLILNSLRNLKC